MFIQAANSGEVRKGLREENMKERREKERERENGRRMRGEKRVKGDADYTLEKWREVFNFFFFSSNSRNSHYCPFLSSLEF